MLLIVFLARSTQWNHPGIELDEANQSDPEARRRRFHISHDDTLSLSQRQSIVSENDSTIDHLHNLSIHGEPSQSSSSEERRDQTDAGSTTVRQHPIPNSSTGNTVGATGGSRYKINLYKYRSSIVAFLNMIQPRLSLVCIKFV